MIGRAGIKIPFLERKDNLIVKQISVDIKTNGYVPTLDFIGVAIKQNELRIKQAELKRESDLKQADADAAYKIQSETQRKVIEATAVEADIARQEKSVELRKKEAEVKKFEMERNAEAIRINADAVKYQAEQEAEAIRAKVLPEVAANVAKPLENVDKITMYGEGNTAKLVEDITKATTQVSTGLTEGLGVDLKSVLAGALGTKVLEGAKTEKGAEQ